MPRAKKSDFIIEKTIIIIDLNSVNIFFLTNGDVDILVNLISFLSPKYFKPLGSTVNLIS